MKKTIRFGLALLALCSLCSCSKPSNGSGDGDGNLFTITPEEGDEFSEGTYGGMLIEIGTDSWLVENSTYECTFTSRASSKVLRVETSHTKYATITYDAKNPTSFTINTLKPGDSWLKIYDADDMLVYRHVIHVRECISQDDMAKDVFDHEKWLSTGIYGDYTLEASSVSPFTMTVYGDDDFDTGSSMTFTATYTEEDKYYYYYELAMDSYENTSKKLTDMMISKCGDRMFIYYGISDISLLEMFSWVEGFRSSVYGE